jgi:adenosine deaminase
MTNELWECHKAFGWGWEEISAVADTGIRNAFIPQAEKDPVMERLRSWYGTNPSYN